ncbi:MAG: hypothetical protein FWH16_05900, partial [Oscillospiraceae bacterium]|nr:hypothetical protein [Oscillospiraceae bacterium]
VDRIDQIPMLHADGIVKAMSYSMNGGAQLKEHLKMYVNREKEFERCLIDAVRASVTVDMDIYKELCCILSKAQEEIFRVKQISERLDLGGWNGHDIARVSKDLHKHHEDHDNMDYTLS